MSTDVRTRYRRIGIGVAVALLLLVVGATATAAGQDPDGGNESEACDFDQPEWREAQTVAGVDVQEDPSCRPDNPNVVAAATKGTNNVPMDVLMKSGLARDAVRKHNDTDGDGDPDVIEITIEIQGINEYDEQDATHEIAPGVKPAFWTFAPKTRGMVSNGSKAEALIRMPAPPIRVEQGDEVRLTVENTHYFPHTVHLHGVDHPFSVNGEGNDGVPQASEDPIMPGESRTYEFQPREPGTMFYHCHVVPDVHVMMGLNGMFVIEEERPNNTVQTFNIGAGKVRHPSAAVTDEYDGEFDLQYQDIDAELHNISQQHNDPRKIAKTMNREYDKGEADPDYFLLNGRSFPYTIRESLLPVEENSTYRLRALNGGSQTVSLHTHGHKAQIEAYDGVEVEDSQEITRDVVTLTAAQRVDMTLNTTNDGLHSYGDGVWFFHDHREAAVTNDGIGPGGTVTMITYESHLRDDGIPETNTDLSKFFDEAYYRGEEPVWGPLDEKRLGEPPEEGNQSGDGHGHSHEAENPGGTDQDHSLTETNGSDAVGGSLLPLGVTIVIGLLALLRARSGGER
jgi:hypothetical protein